MQAHGSQKDQEIIKLNMNLADEKRRMMDVLKTSGKSPFTSNKSLTSAKQGSPSKMIDEYT